MCACVRACVRVLCGGFVPPSALLPATAFRTARLEGRGFPQWQPDPANSTDPRNKRRGFARSDDGGYTWAEIWVLADRQPEIQSCV